MYLGAKFFRRHRQRDAQCVLIGLCCHFPLPNRVSGVTQIADIAAERGVI